MLNPAESPIKILFIHKNFPAQFGRLAQWLAGQGWDVSFATQLEGAEGKQFTIVPFTTHREVTPGIHRYVAGLERSVINAQGFARKALQLSRNGYQPDLVVAHSGWGVGSLAKDIWPDCVYVPYFEWYYNWPPIDRTPHDKAGNELEGRAHARLRNASCWLDFSSADAAICPTRFQVERFPEFLRDRLTVLPDGVDTDLHRPGPKNYKLLEHIGVPPGAEVLTYLARGMEPARGFPEMMRAVSALQSTRKNLHTVIVGNDRVAYGRQIEECSWKERMTSELDLDAGRIHFTGLVSQTDMIGLFQSSDVHLYLTAPFVLSWSILEAMSCGCLIVASNTEPVCEFITHEETGLLCDMNDHEALVSMVNRALMEKSTLRPIKVKARKSIIETLDAKRIAFPLKKKFFEDLLSQKDRRGYGGVTQTKQPLANPARFNPENFDDGH